MVDLYNIYSFKMVWWEFKRTIFVFLMGKILLKSEMRQDVAGRLLGQGGLSGLESSPVGTYVVWFLYCREGSGIFYPMVLCGEPF